MSNKIQKRYIENQITQDNSLHIYNIFIFHLNVFLHEYIQYITEVFL